MSIELFLIILAALFAVLFAWAFRVLPQEQWQIIAAIPLSKTDRGDWHGLNLTYYGFFQATSNALAVAIMFVLLGAVGVNAKAVFALIIILFAVCWPAAKLIARVVEKKKHTFTIGGAIFVGVLIAPWVIELLNRTMSDELGGSIPAIPAMAAAAVAYALGEGLGRLACISFGCCYGKSLDQLSPRQRRLFGSFNFKFAGATKKVAYEGLLEGAPVVPVQAITAVVFLAIALTGTYLFLKSHFAAAMLLTMALTQSWRFVSETLRADERGKAQVISAYQVMAVLMVIYAVAIVIAFSSAIVGTIEIKSGLALLWSPAVLLFCQALWIAVFLITGRSSVTGATLAFFVHRDKI